MRILIFLILPVLAFAFSKGSPPRDSDISEISFSATSCFGVCPAYSVVFTDSGVAELRWKPYHRKIIAQRDSMFGHIVAENISDSILKSSKILVFRGKIGIEQFDSLAEFFQSKKFFSMTDYRENVTDLPTFYFSAVRSGVKKTVSMYGLHPPEDMVELKNAIEDMIMRLDWQFVGESEK